MPRKLVIPLLLVVVAWLAASYFSRHPEPATASIPRATEPTASATPSAAPAAPLPGERLLTGYGDPAKPPIEDLRKVRRVITGYFSVVKDVTRFPIGGNEDLTAALLGENANRQAFLPEQHAAIDNHQLVDRWQTPLFVHPEAARELTLRSAGPDRTMFTDDDLILAPNGEVQAAK